MENSYTYKMIMKDLYLSKNSPREVGGYIAGWYNECSEEERNELAHLIWNEYCNGNSSFWVEYMPDLINYDGISKLQETFDTEYAMNGVIAKIARVLYQAFRDDKYIETIANIIPCVYPHYGCIHELVKCGAGEKQNRILADIYVNHRDSIDRRIAIEGLLYNIGSLNSEDSKEKRQDVLKTYDFGSIEKRREALGKIQIEHK